MKRRPAATSGLANPPFAGSLDYENVAKDLLQTVKTKKTELLFLALFLRLLSRRPTAAEKAKYSAYLGEGFAGRLTQSSSKSAAYPRKPAYYVSWSNHLNDLATTVRMQEEAAARKGDPATDRLTTEWRRRAEDVVWALVNSPEFLYN